MDYTAGTDLLITLPTCHTWQLHIISHDLTWPQLLSITCLPTSLTQTAPFLLDLTLDLPRIQYFHPYNLQITMYHILLFHLGQHYLLYRGERDNISIILIRKLLPSSIRKLLLLSYGIITYFLWELSLYFIRILFSTKTSHITYDSSSCFPHSSLH